MQHIWQYVQRNSHKNIVVACWSNNVCVDVKNDIYSTLLAHRHSDICDEPTIINEIGSKICYNSNRIYFLSAQDTPYYKLKGMTIHVLLLSEGLDPHARTKLIWHLIQQMPPKGERIISTYIHSPATTYNNEPF